MWAQDFFWKFYQFKLEDRCVNSDLELSTVEFLYWFLNVNVMETVILSQEKSQKATLSTIDETNLINL